MANLHTPKLTESRVQIAFRNVMKPMAACSRVAFPVAIGDRASTKSADEFNQEDERR